MAAEVRAVRDDAEFAASVHAVGTAFLERPSDDFIAWRASHGDLDRVLIALDDGIVCGTARSFPTPLTMPGGQTVAMGAVSAVGVLPTHRRRGHLSRLMDLQLGDIAERGEPIAGLIAAEWPIYGRYGYGPAVAAATYEVDTRLASFIESSWHGTVELVDLATLRQVAPPVFDACRVATPGSIGRNDSWWDSVLGVTPEPTWKDDPKRFRALHRDASGAIDGYVTYSAKGTWEQAMPAGTLHVGELFAQTPDAYADLWRFLSEIDWTVSVKASPRPVDEPLQLLLHDGRAMQQTHRGDHIWLRVLDIAAVLTARAYRTSGRVVLDVVDDALGHGGRFALDASPDGATCTPTDALPDLTMPIATLGAACVGGTPLTLLAAAGLVDEHSPAAVVTAGALLSWSPAPYCSTNF
jgi:predicted acetyltransferase